jgi:hypothetical protein
VLGRDLPTTIVHNVVVDYHISLLNVDYLGVDCDEVFPGILLGNGATVKKKARTVYTLSIFTSLVRV